MARLCDGCVTEQGKSAIQSARKKSQSPVFIGFTTQAIGNILCDGCVIERRWKRNSGLVHAPNHLFLGNLMCWPCDEGGLAGLLSGRRNVASYCYRYTYGF